MEKDIKNAANDNFSINQCLRDILKAKKEDNARTSKLN